MDYRNALRAKGMRPLSSTKRASLRTVKQPGDVEIVAAGMVRYGEGGEARAA